MAKKKQTPVVEKVDSVPIPQNTEGSSVKNDEDKTVKNEPQSASKPVKKPTKVIEKEKTTEPKPPQSGSLERRMEDYINSRKPVDDTTKN